MTFTASLEAIVAADASGLLSKHEAWERVRLGDVCSVLNGYPFPSARFSSTSGFPLLRIRDVRSSTTVMRFDGDFDSAFVVHPGELVIGMDGNFEAARWMGPPALLNQRVCKVSPDNRFLSAQYLAYLLPSYLSAVNANTPSMTVKHLSSLTVADLPLALPPRKEQDRIAADLDDHFTRLDDAVAGLERVQRNLKRYRASVLKAAIEGRLVQTEAELARAEDRSYEPASALLDRILAERRERYEESGRKGKYQEAIRPDPRSLPPLPQGWSWTTMGSITVAGPQNGLYVPKARYGSGTPILRIDDFQVDWSRSSADLDRVRISEAQAQQFALRRGNLVVNRVNSPSHLGKAVVIDDRHTPAVFESNMMRIELSQHLDSHLFKYFLESAACRQRLLANAKWAVNQASINQDDVARTALPLPPAEEQARILRAIEVSMAMAGRISGLIRATDQRSRNLRQAILKWAFEGRLADQDPNDEPASVLMEKIRAERPSAAEAGSAKARTGRGRSR